MKCTLAAAALLLAGLSSSCASTQTVHYSSGSVTSSMVTYEYVAPPVFKTARGVRYHVKVRGVESGEVLLPLLRQKGMRSVTDEDEAEIVVHIEVKQVDKGKPGALGLGGKYYPASVSKAPYEIRIENSSGQRLAGHTGAHEEVVTLKGAPSFPSREEATEATEFIHAVGSDAIVKNAKAGALAAAKKDANGLARVLFEEQTIAMDVPVVRSAAGVELLEAYELVAEADTPDQIRSALSRYERAELQLGQAGSDGNCTARYGVACGIAACKLMLRDLSGAWAAASVAKNYEPMGREADDIRAIIYEEEVVTGLNVIPEAEREEIDKNVESVKRWAVLIDKIAN